MPATKRYAKAPPISSPGADRRVELQGSGSPPNRIEPPDRGRPDDRHAYQGPQDDRRD